MMEWIMKHRRIIAILLLTVFVGVGYYVEKIQAQEETLVPAIPVGEVFGYFPGATREEFYAAIAFEAILSHPDSGYHARSDRGAINAVVDRAVIYGADMGARFE